MNYRDRDREDLTVSVIDNADAVAFQTKFSVADGSVQFDASVYLTGTEVRRMIRELTEIANRRGFQGGRVRE